MPSVREPMAATDRIGDLARLRSAYRMSDNVLMAVPPAVALCSDAVLVTPDVRQYRDPSRGDRSEALDD